MNDDIAILSNRLIPALFYGVVVVAAIYLGGFVLTGVLFLALILLSLEWAAMVGWPLGGTRHLTLLAMGGVAFALASTGFWGYAVVVFALHSIASCVARSWRNPSIGDLGGLYLGTFLIAMLWHGLANDQGSKHLALLIAIVWATDSGAFVMGKLIGGPKLWPQASPAKTWSGAIGGLICGILAAMLMVHFIAAGISHMIVILGAGLSLAAQIGDLTESKFKRSYGIKHSGHIMRGHGGLLDRMDSLIITAPIYALIIRIWPLGGL